MCLTLCYVYIYSAAALQKNGVSKEQQKAGNVQHNELETQSSQSWSWLGDSCKLPSLHVSLSDWLWNAVQARLQDNVTSCVKADFVPYRNINRLPCLHIALDGATNSGPVIVVQPCHNLFCLAQLIFHLGLCYCATLSEQRLGNSNSRYASLNSQLAC